MVVLFLLPDVDLLLPGQKPCAYFVIISAQDSPYRFLRSLFFSASLYKLTPEELPGYSDLQPCRIINYVPEWKNGRQRGRSRLTASPV